MSALIMSAHYGLVGDRRRILYLYIYFRAWQSTFPSLAALPLNQGPSWLSCILDKQKIHIPEMFGRIFYDRPLWNLWIADMLEAKTKRYETLSQPGKLSFITRLAEFSWRHCNPFT